jgi:hypothetical protein
MSLIHSINLRSVSALITLLGVLVVGRSSGAQMIGLSPPLSGASAVESALGSGSTLGFSSVYANDVNADRILDTLDYVINVPTVSDPSDINLGAADDISEFEESSWPQFNTSSSELADALTTRLGNRVSTPRSHDSRSATLAGMENIQSWNGGPEGVWLSGLAEIDGEFPGAAQPGDPSNGVGSADGLLTGASRMPIRSFLGPGPLVSPEPGVFALMAAMCLAAVLIVSREIVSREIVSRKS